MKKIFTLVMTALVLSSASFVANAEAAKMVVKVDEGTDSGKVYINPFSITAGETAEIDVLLDNPDYGVTAFQFDLLLPEGLSVAYDDEEEVYLIDSTSRHTKAHQLSSSKIAGGYRAICFSTESKPLKNNSGAIAVVTFQAAPDFKGGEISISEIEIVEPDATKHNPGAVTATVSETSGVELVSVENVAAVYYNLQGVRVENPTKGVFVKVQNGKAVKVVK